MFTRCSPAVRLQQLAQEVKDPLASISSVKQVAWVGFTLQDWSQNAQYCRAASTWSLKGIVKKRGNFIGEK